MRTDIVSDGANNMGNHLREVIAYSQGVLCRHRLPSRCSCPLMRAKTVDGKTVHASEMS